MGKQRGNSLGINCFKVLLSVFGLVGAYSLLYPVCFYYLIFDRTAVKSASKYISLIFPGSGNIKKYIHIYRLFLSQGKQIIDRYAFISGKVAFDITINNKDTLINTISESKNGCIILTSHFGSWQVTMSALDFIGREIFLVMNEEQNESVQKIMNFTKSSAKIHILHNEDKTTLILGILKVLSDGNLVSIMGDRHYGHKTCKVRFLGEYAYFPCGAFNLATAADCPVIVLFSMKTAPKKYVVEVSSVIYNDRETGEGLKDKCFNSSVEEYCRDLEEYSMRFPYQCFLFEDIWENNNK